MKIYLVRHGEALSPEVDPNRPLSPQGKEMIEKIAMYLRDMGCKLSHILCSQKLRSKQTAEIMSKHILVQNPLYEHPQMAPNDPIESAFLYVASKEEDAMLVSHLPYLQKLLSHMLTGDEHFNFVDFKEGTTVCLDSFKGNWIIAWAIGLDQVYKR